MFQFILVSGITVYIVVVSVYPYCASPIQSANPDVNQSLVLAHVCMSAFKSVILDNCWYDITEVDTVYYCT